MRETAQSHTTEVKSQTYGLKASSIALLIWTADGRSHPAVPPNPAAHSRHRIVPQRDSENRQKPCSAEGKTRNSNSPPPASSSHDTSSLTLHISKRTMASRWSHSQSNQSLGSSTPARWRRRRIHRQQTPQHLTMIATTSPPTPASNPQPSILQAR